MIRHLSLAGVGLLVMSLAMACGPSTKTETRPDKAGGEQAGAAGGQGSQAAPKVSKMGPTVAVAHNMMAEVWHVLEGVSRWNRRMSMALYKDFEGRFGIDDALKAPLKKIALFRNELWEKDAQAKVQRTFEVPFGPEGLMPKAQEGKVSQLWQAVVNTSEPAALKRALAGVVEPIDADALSQGMQVITPKVAEIIKGVPNYPLAAADLQRLMDTPAVDQLLARLATFFGLNAKDMRFRVHPVWLPASEPAAAMAFGDVILVGLPQGKRMGPEQVAQVVGQISLRMLAKLSAKQKAFISGRFIERAGLAAEFPDRLFLVDMLRDATGYGLAAPLVASGPAQVPSWPGDALEQGLAEASTALLRKALAAGKTFDGAFAIEAAKVCEQIRKPKPADYVDGAMVIAQEPALKPFKAQVQRWMVWKFPPTKKYNYPVKLDYVPGRSVLMMLTPRDLATLPKRFAARQAIVRALNTAAAQLKKHKGVMVTLPRDTRGYIFIIGAASPKAMEQMAETFFKLAAIPDKPVVLD